MSERLRRSAAGRPGRTGWVVWSCCALSAAAIGLLFLIDRWGVPGAFICAVLGALTAAVIASAVWSGDDARGAIRQMIRLMLGAGLVVPTAIGLIAEFGFTGVLMVLLLAATQPALVARVRARWFTAGELPRPPDDRPPHRHPRPPAPNGSRENEPTVSERRWRKRAGIGRRRKARTGDAPEPSGTARNGPAANAGGEKGAGGNGAAAPAGGEERAVGGVVGGNKGGESGAGDNAARNDSTGNWASGDAPAGNAGRGTELGVSGTVGSSARGDGPAGGPVAGNGAGGSVGGGHGLRGSGPVGNAGGSEAGADTAVGKGGGGSAAADEPLSELSLLDDAALCLAWRRSYVLLESARSPHERLAIVDQRQKYLDELHRRSPDGLAAWFASGARASGNPLPYMDEDRRRIDD